ncbi:MAG: 2-hydroxyacid dehydrogenase [Nitrososphaeria archaeon]|nr:D-glycerate dehydrogenase [Conexivisphaerales archaeon]
MQKVVVSFRLFKEWIEFLKDNGFEVIAWDSSVPPSKEWIKENIKDADGLLCSLVNRIDREIIDAAERLKVISTFSVGFDHIDVNYAKSKKIRIGYTPEVLTDATADLIFALLLAVARRVVEGDKLIRSGRWNQPWTPDFMIGTEVNGKVLGIIGMGRIGRALVKRAKGFNMRVIYNSRTKKEVEAEFVDLDTLLRESDFVVLAVDLNPTTYHMVNRDFLNKMKRSAFLINASRGKVVDEKALTEALQSGTIRGAALDVFEEEPTSLDNPLIKLENVVLTPHIGSATFETRQKMAEVSVKNLIAGVRGEKMVFEL